MLAIAMHGSD